jgi:hypothetical protein
VQCHNVDISITRVPGHAAAEGSQVLVSWPMQGAGLVVLSECKRKTRAWRKMQMWSGESGQAITVRAGVDDVPSLPRGDHQ